MTVCSSLIHQGAIFQPTASGSYTVGFYPFEDARFASAVSKREHGARNDDDEQLSTTAFSLLATLGATAERQDKQEGDLEDMKKELASSLAGLNDRLDKQLRSVTRMHDFIHNLGDIVLGVRGLPFRSLTSKNLNFYFI